MRPHKVPVPTTDTKKLNIIQICPDIKSLSSVSVNVLCPVEECYKILPNTGSLSLHLTKTHGIGVGKMDDPDTSSVTHFCCPVEMCVYGLDKGRYFSSMKCLKQHYLKVHAERLIQCPKCEKTFATQYLLKAHLRSCGLTFECDCGLQYKSYEAILTHMRRSGHGLGDKCKSNPAVEQIPISPSITNKTEEPHPPSCSKPANLFPKPKQGELYPVDIMAAIALSELSRSCLAPKIDVGIQTDPVLHEGKKCIRKPSSPARSGYPKKKQCAGTQTVVRTRQPKRSAETQTNCTTQKRMKESKSSQCSGKVRNRKSSVTMQTALKNEVIADNSTSIEIDVDQWLTNDTNATDIQQNSTELATFLNSWENLLDDASEQQTKLLSSQTQTEFLLPNYLLESPDDFDDNELFNDLTFNTTQTQTTWPFCENLVSTETQTCTPLDVLPNSEMSDMETQTAELDDLIML